MTDKRHTYSIRVDWTGNQGAGTSAYRAYSRAHEISAQGKTAAARGYAFFGSNCERNGRKGDRLLRRFDRERRQSRWLPLRLTALLYLGCPTAQHAARLLQRNVKFAAAQHSLCSVSRAFWCYASQQGMGKASCLSVCFLTSLPLGLA